MTRAILQAAGLLLAAVPAQAANPSMSRDFERMMQWLSHEMAQGLAFNAGSTFDPPREVKDKRLQPDISLGVGSMPLDKSKFPEPETPALKDLGAADIFPSRVLFPNLTMHLRSGLPWRSDFAIRVANMTTPPNYKLSGDAAGKGQSNSIGFTLRKHLLGGARPLLSLGAHYNHVFGRFRIKTKFKVDDVQGFSAESEVLGDIQWNVTSLGFNAVVSDTFGRWTPFLGYGYNYASGSVRARLDAVSNTPLISPIIGEASERPEKSQARVILGFQLNRSWANFFANGEVKTIGIGIGQSWIVHAGMNLPFHIGTSFGSSARREVAPREATARAPSPEEPSRPSTRKEMVSGSVRGEEEAPPALIFIQ